MRRGIDFRRVYARRKSASVPAITLCGCENDLPQSRLGLSVTKKVAASAVIRNRWKRLLREAFRQTRAEWPPGIDWVAIPRQLQPLPLAELQAVLLGLTRRVTRQLQSSRPSVPRKP